MNMTLIFTRLLKCSASYLYLFSNRYYMPYSSILRLYNTTPAIVMAGGNRAMLRETHDHPQVRAGLGLTGTRDSWVAAAWKHILTFISPEPDEDEAQLHNAMHMQRLENIFWHLHCLSQMNRKHNFTTPCTVNRTLYTRHTHAAV